MNTISKTLKLSLIMPLVFFLTNCREKTAEKPAEARMETQLAPLPKALKELAEFVNMSVTDTTNGRELMTYKIVESSGLTRTADMDEALKLYRAITKSKEVEFRPVFELKNSNEAILIFQGKGYIGRIWATVLVGRSSGKIKKIQFGHLAESEGLGARIIEPAFSSQFNNTLLNDETETFGLKQNGQIVIDGNQWIDGISGATVTSQSVVNMMNKGREQYQNYLHPEE